VTWRLAGSLPVAKTTDFWTSDGPKFVEFDRLLDAVSMGPRWLERAEIANIVVNSLRNGERESRYALGAWVVMPNHVHAALQPLSDHDLASSVRMIKGRSAREANCLINKAGSQFWAKDYFDRRIRDRDHEERVTRYIQNNPVKAGLCGSVGEWPWSSAYIPVGAASAAPAFKTTRLKSRLPNTYS
jgi:REP element-mobilizing transposase RayT